MPVYFCRNSLICSLRYPPMASTVLWSAPPYSGTILSITPRRFRSSDVIFMTSLASLARSASFHNIEAKPSGDRIEYVAFSIIHTSLPTAVANAPPLPPSPIRMHNTGTFRADISSRFRAMASPCPLSSASTPQKAPGVFTKLIMGRWNFSACFIRRSALRYPSGMGIP